MNKVETNTVKPEISFNENDTQYLLINTLEESTLDNKILELENYMKNNPGKGKSDKEKDDLYKAAQQLWRNYANSLKDTKYNFYLNKAQYKFLTDLILSKLEYDVNTVFFAIELTDTLANMKDMKFVNEQDLLNLPVNATEITYIYHLIAKHKVKGLTKDAYTFANILKRIGAISKIFNYYDTTGKNLSTDIQDWVSTFDEGVILSQPQEESIQAKVSKPKKKEQEA
jgi:hypothetical protein